MGFVVFIFKWVLFCLGCFVGLNVIIRIYRGRFCLGGFRLGRFRGDEGDRCFWRGFLGWGFKLWVFGTLDFFK